MRTTHIFVFCTFYALQLFVLPVNFAFAIGAENLLRAEQAFQVSARMSDAEHVQLHFSIADGYYLYREKIAVTTDLPSITLGQLELPEGQSKHDENFGDVVIYHDDTSVTLPVSFSEPMKQFSIKVKYQGCADVGVCYPPQKTVVTLDVPATQTPLATDAANVLNVPKSESASVPKLLKDFSTKPSIDDLLPADQAFQLFADLKDSQTVQLNWLIAEDYYLYREKIQVRLLEPTSVSLGNLAIPPGEPHHDEAFGDVQIFHQEFQVNVPLIRPTPNATRLVLEVGFQGCAERGVCYSPMLKTLNLELPTAPTLSNESTNPKSKVALSEQDQIIRALHQDTLWLTLLSFFGFGLLLAFTPCIFPMIPILSGIIVGKGRPPSSMTAFLLSLSYVLAGAVTYTIFGILAALFGSNLQATFQQPWIIALFSGIFILLALSMFGFYHLELPKAFQSRLHDSSDKFRNGSYWGAAIMGALSSLIVGPCVAAPLAAALIYIGQTGDVLLGGSALFMLGLGMGVPLLIIGTSAGKLLPKAGHWLTTTKSIFGVIMLAMAVWMLQRILPSSVSLLFWALLLIIPAMYLHAIDPLPEQSSNWQRFWKGVGFVMLIYGVMILVGLGMGNSNPLAPLQGINSSGPLEKQAGLAFTAIRSNAELDSALQQSSSRQQTVMLDFYADWCISCKEMEYYTFTDPAVQNRLKNMLLLRIDMTNNTEQDQALLKRFHLIGPPAILFFDNNKNEQTAFRVIGFQDSKTFLSGIQNVQ